MPTHVPFLKGQTRDGEARKVTHLPQRCQGLFCGEGQIMCLIMIQGLALQHQGHTLLLIHSISCWGHWEVCIKIRAGTRLLRNEEAPLWEAPGIPDIAQCGKKAFNIWLSLGYRDPCLACVYSGNNWTQKERRQQQSQGYLESLKGSLCQPCYNYIPSHSLPLWSVLLLFSSWQ